MNAYDFQCVVQTILEREREQKRWIKCAHAQEMIDERKERERKKRSAEMHAAPMESRINPV